MLALAGEVPSAVQLAMPDPVSEQVKVTVTSLLFQPFAFLAGDWLCVIVGPVWSIWTWTVWCASSLPALSTLQYSRVWTPSALMVMAEV